jgi:hypothetical protein
MTALPSNCLDCPMARHLERDRFSCGNSLSKVVRGHHSSTAECHDAVRELPQRCLVLSQLYGRDTRPHCAAVAHKVEVSSTSMRRYFHPLPLPDLQGLEPEWVCNWIHLSLNWLDVNDDAPGAKDGEIAIEVCHQDFRIGHLRRDADIYYCDRLLGMRSPDPYWLALHLIHPNYLHQVPDEIVAARSLVPEYF